MQHSEAEMRLYTQLNFGGNCAEAFRFYEKHLGGKIMMMMTHDQNPEGNRMPAEMKNGVLHAQLELGGAALMGADIPGAQPMRSVYLSLEADSDQDAERIFKLLADGGEVFMPIQE